MTEEVQVETAQDNTRAYYLEQADTLGLNVPRNISTAKLVEVVGNKLKALKSQEKQFSDKGAEQFKDMRALVRVRVTVLNPAKQNWSGEIFTVGNDVIPHMTRYIPFNAVDGIWHVERMFVEMLKNRKYQFIPVGKDGKADTAKRKLLPEFRIEELPPLTAEELEELKVQQFNNQSIQEE